MTLQLYVYDSGTGQWIPATQDLLSAVKAVGFQVAPTVTFTRPNDTNVYAVGDAVSSSTTAPTILTFTNAARAAGGTGVVLAARHVKNSNSTTNASFRLWLYQDSVSAVNDNATVPSLWANRAKSIGYIDFNHTVGGAGSDSTVANATFLNMPFTTVGTALYGQLVANAAYTPTAQEQHFIEIDILQN